MLFSLSEKKKNYQNYICFPNLGVTSPTTHMSCLLLFVLKDKTRNKSTRACFSNLSCPLLHNPYVIWRKFSSTFKDNCKIFTWTDIFKPNCPLIFYHLVKNILDLVFQIKPKAINGKAGWGTKDTVQRSMTWPTGFLSQVTGNLRLASRGDQRQKFFFLSFTFSCPIRRKGVLEGTTLQRGIQPSLLALYLCLLLGALTKNSVTLYKMTEDSRLILTKKQQQVLPLFSFLAFISSDVVGNYRCINQTISLWAERLRSMSVAMTTTSRLQLGGQLGYHLKDFLHDMKSWTFLFQLSCLFLGFMLFWAFFAVIILTALVELWSLSLNENIQFCA